MRGVLKLIVDAGRLMAVGHRGRGIVDRIRGYINKDRGGIDTWGQRTLPQYTIDGNKPYRYAFIMEWN